jgi:hypothetical protein
MQQSELAQVPSFLTLFVRSPLNGIRVLPPWHWRTFIVLLFITAVLSGLLLGLFSWSFVNLILGVLVLPVTSIIGSFVMTFFIFYYFSTFRKVYLDSRRLFGVVSVSQIPFLFLHVFSGVVAPIDLIGFGCFCLVLIVGLVEQFHIDKKSAIRIAALLYFLYVSIWVFSQIRNDLHGNQELKKDQSPQSLDRMEKDLKK